VLTVINAGTAPPGILVTADTLGLRTARGGYVLPSGYADDLDGLAIPFYIAPPQGCEAGL